MLYYFQIHDWNSGTERDASGSEPLNHFLFEQSTEYEIPGIAAPPPLFF